MKPGGKKNMKTCVPENTLKSLEKKNIKNSGQTLRAEKKPDNIHIYTL